MMLFLMLLALPSDAPNSIILSQIEGPIIASTLGVKSTGGFYYGAGDTLFIWDEEGALVQKLSLGDSFNSSLVVHLADDDVYLAMDRQQNGVAVQGDGRRVHLRPEALGARTLAFRDLLTVDGLVFGMKALDPWNNPDANVIVPLDLEQTDDGGFKLINSGPAFAPLPEKNRRISINFKKHWLVRDSMHGNLYLAQQLSSRLRHFVPSENGYRLEKEIRLALPRFAPAPTVFDQTINSRKAFAEWTRTFSRLAGFDRYEDGLVVAYHVPDNKDGSVVLLQKITNSGRNVGRPLQVNGFYLGVSNNHALILDPEKPIIKRHPL